MVVVVVVGPKGTRLASPQNLHSGLGGGVVVVVVVVVVSSLVGHLKDKVTVKKFMKISKNFIARLLESNCDDVYFAVIITLLEIQYFW